MEGKYLFTPISGVPSQQSLSSYCITLLRSHLQILTTTNSFFFFVCNLDLPWRKFWCQHSCFLWPFPTLWLKKPQSNLELKRTQKTLDPNCPRPSPEVGVSFLFASNFYLVGEYLLIHGAEVCAKHVWGSRFIICNYLHFLQKKYIFVLKHISLYHCFSTGWA